MKWISTSDEVRELDRRTIDDVGVSALALMETASHAVACAVRAHHHPEAARGVVVACGSGNNGGDGYAVARWLHRWGYPVGVLPVRPPRSPEAQAQRRTAELAGVPVLESAGSPALVVDALLGTGVSQAVRGDVRDAMVALGALGVPVVAVDVPSGLDVDLGRALGPVMPARRTVTFARLKPGMFCGEGPELCGVIDLVDIGLAPGPELASAELVGSEDLRWPARDGGGHKGSSGRLTVVAGSEQMAGAAILACRGALAAGVGLLTLVAPAGAAPRLKALPPEVMWVRSGDGPVLEGIPAEAVASADALVVGPGLGQGRPLSEQVSEALVELWRDARQAVLFDADALPFARGRGAGPRVVTPHPGEAGRMLGRTTAQVTEDRFDAARTLAGADHVALLKGRFTLVAAPGHRVSVNSTNSPTLSTGGTGDVLAGLVGGLLARGLGAREAAVLGAFVHGRAGEKVGETSTTPSATSVVDALPLAIAEIPS